MRTWVGSLSIEVIVPLTQAKQRRYTLSGDKLFYIVRQYLTLRGRRPLHSFSRVTLLTHYENSLSARRYTLSAAARH
ncbi:hypothetical protein GW17_00044045 [Ensete ventricosum]|nr:hypothetical protein GW17_00044045 [Ensete ventricosum]